MTETTRKTVLTDAMQCVCTDREAQYGTPENNFAVIADFWNVYEKSKLKSSGKTTYESNGDWVTEYPLDAHDVAIMMCLLKIARIASGQTKADNYIDLAGYAACAGEVALKEK